MTEIKKKQKLRKMMWRDNIMGKSLTLTVVANMTSNYGEGLGNIASVQKVYRKGRVYAVRTRESLKNAIMVQSGLYDDLDVIVDGATQKKVSKELNVSNCKALEGGYMNTENKSTYIRNSSFYLTDAVACDEFVNETRFHNNLYMAQTYAEHNNINLQEKSKDCGLMPYQYEYDKSLKQYSITIDLDMVGKDFNFNSEADNKEKAARVNAILEAVENLNLIVKGNMDNAEPLFVVGGLVNRKTHYFENVVTVKDNMLLLESKDLLERIENGCHVGLLQGGKLENEDEIISKLNPVTIGAFFDTLRTEVNDYYGV